MSLEEEQYATCKLSFSAIKTLVIKFGLLKAPCNSKILLSCCLAEEITARVEHIENWKRYRTAGSNGRFLVNFGLRGVDKQCGWYPVRKGRQLRCVGLRRVSELAHNWPLKHETFTGRVLNSIRRAQKWQDR